MVHIAMISGEYPPSGGVGYYVRYLSYKLIENGYQVSVLTRGNRKPLTVIKEGNLTIYKIKYLPIFPFHVKFHGIFLNKFFSAKEKLYDIVHLHNPLIPDVKTKLPKILTEHGSVRGFIDGLENRDFFSIAQKIFRKYLINHDKKVIKNANLVTTVSKTCKKDLELNYGIYNSIIVYNAVDHVKFHPIPLEERNVNNIVFCGSLITKKGIFDLLKALIDVKKEIPNVVLKIIGDGPLRNKIIQYVKNNKLEKNVVMFGYLNHEKLISEYQKSSLYVLPSYHEGLPTTTLEAMACGLPVITTNVEGNTELVKTGYNGVKVPPFRPDLLGKNIIKILNNSDIQNYYGNNNRTIIEKKYTWDITAKRFMKLYEMINN